MHFIKDDNYNPIGPNTKYVYRSNDYAIDIIDRFTNGVFITVMVNDVYIETDSDAQLSHCWGICPAPGWQNIRLLIPAIIQSNVSIGGVNLDQNFVTKINDDGRWPVYFDKEKMILCIGNNSPEILIEFNTNSYVSLDENKMIDSLWVKIDKIE